MFITEQHVICCQRLNKNEEATREVIQFICAHAGQLMYVRHLCTLQRHAANKAHETRKLDTLIQQMPQNSLTPSESRVPHSQRASSLRLLVLEIKEFFHELFCCPNFSNVLYLSSVLSCYFKTAQRFRKVIIIEKLSL